MNFPDTPVNLVGVDIVTFIRVCVGTVGEGDSNCPNTNDQSAGTDVHVNLWNDTRGVIYKI